MKKLQKYAVLALAAVFVAIQLVPVHRDNPPVASDLDAPADVKSILRRACYDCHSNETRWPWYAYVAPVSWLVAHDVEEGRRTTTSLTESGARCLLRLHPRARVYGLPLIARQVWTRALCRRTAGGTLGGVLVEFHAGPTTPGR